MTSYKDAKINVISNHEKFNKVNLVLNPLSSIKEINDSYESTKFITTYYDNKKNKNYIITGNKGYLKSYDFS